MFNIDNAVTLAAKAQSAEGSLDKSKDALCAFFAAAGVTSDDMKAPAKGANSDDWGSLKAVAIRVVTIKGKKLGDEEIADFFNPEVSAKKLLKGTPKAGAGNSWNGNVTSMIGKWRKWQDAFEKRGQEAAPRDVKDDAEYIVAKFGDVIKRLGRDAERFDGSFPYDRAAAFTKDLDALLKTYGLAKAK